jgi:two-component sensor histidine kinase
MQHRVKNSFQIILASIAIQRRRYSQAMLNVRWTTSVAASTRFRSRTTS